MTSNTTEILSSESHVLIYVYVSLTVPKLSATLGAYRTIHIFSTDYK